MKPKRFVLVCSIILFGSKSFSQHNAPNQVSKNAPVVITGQMTHQLIDNIRVALVENYIFPDTAIKMIANLEKEFKKGSYSTIRDPRQLAYRLENDLQAAHHDGHLAIMYEPGFVEQLLDTVGANEKRKLNDSLALVDMRHNNFLFNKVEILAGNIGYVSFDGFPGFVQEAKPTFTAAFRFVANTSALIIDLRNNGGGSPEMVNQVESYFFKEKTHLNDIVDRSGNATIFWTDPAKADNLILSMPVYILTSKHSFSGAEDFSYGLQSVKRAIVVGDTTGGGAHPTAIYNIGMGFLANIPHLRSLNPYTHTDWEGTGIIPDIATPAEKSLEAAEKDFFIKQVAAAKTGREKKQMQWTLNLLLAKLNQETMDSTDLATFAGTFEGGLHFYVQGHDLYCKNAERGNSVFKLQHVIDNLFILDENVQVQFMKDQSGQLSGIAMHWSNGGESFKKKENVK